MKKFILLVDSNTIRAKQIKDELEQSDSENICVVWVKDTDELKLQLENETMEFGIIVLGNIREDFYEIINSVKNYREKYLEILIVVIDKHQDIYNEMSKITLLFIHPTENEIIARTILQHYPS